MSEITTKLKCCCCFGFLPVKSRRNVMYETFPCRNALVEVWGKDLQGIMQAMPRGKCYVCSTCFNKLNRLEKIDFNIKNQLSILKLKKEQLLQELRKINQAVNPSSVPVQNMKKEKIYPDPQDEVAMETCSSDRADDNEFDMVKRVPVIIKPEINDHANIEIGPIVEIKPQEDRSEIPEAIQIEVKIEGQDSEIHYWHKQTDIHDIRTSDADANEPSQEEIPFMTGTYSDIKLESAELNILDPMSADIEGRDAEIEGQDAEIEGRYAEKCTEMNTANGPSKEESSSMSESCGASMSTAGESERTGQLNESDQDKPKECSVCGKVFKDNFTVANHMQTHVGEELHTCDICMLQFRCKSILEVHMRKHSGETLHTSDICGRTFTQESHLAYHLESHNEKKPFSCEKCGTRFRKKGSLRSHMMTHEKIDRVLPCNLCEKIFISRSGLVAHKRIHSGKRPHICKECGRGFGQSSTLSRHMVKHGAEKRCAAKCVARSSYTSRP